jgi:hypothetical protein
MARPRKTLAKFLGTRGNSSKRVEII